MTKLKNVKLRYKKIMILYYSMILCMLDFTKAIKMPIKVNGKIHKEYNMIRMNIRHVFIFSESYITRNGKLYSNNWEKNPIILKWIVAA